MKITDEDISYIEATLTQAGKILLKYFKKDIGYTEKTSVKDLLTKADLESEKLIIGRLITKYPKIQIYSEESLGNTTQNTKVRFIVDPLEGTTNLVLGIPVFVIAVALVEGNKCIFSMVHHPILKTTYYALKGRGTYKNRRKISVNDNWDISKSSIHTNYTYGSANSLRIKIDKALYGLGVKRKLDDWCGIYYLCLLAEGKIEAVITDEIHEYDVVPGEFISREAGAKITNWKGKNIGDLYVGRTVASNGRDIHNQMVKMLSDLQ